MPTIYQEVEVEVELDDFDTDDLIEELERRNVAVNREHRILVERLYYAEKLDKDTRPFLDQLYDMVIGRTL